MKKLLLLLLVLPFFISSCSSDEDDKNEDDIDRLTINYGEVYQLKGNTAINKTYRSENEYYVTVSGTGLIKAEKVGETNIILTSDGNTRKIKVIVTSKNNLYETPNLEFGISKEDILKKYGTPNGETADGFGYYRSEKIPYEMYIFDSVNKLISSSVLVLNIYSNDLNIFLNERYTQISNTIDPAYTSTYINTSSIQSANMSIGIETYNEYNDIVWYKPYKITKEIEYKEKYKKLIDILNISNK